MWWKIWLSCDYSWHNKLPPSFVQEPRLHCLALPAPCIVSRKCIPACLHTQPQQYQIAIRTAQHYSSTTGAPVQYNNVITMQWHNTSWRTLAQCKYNAMQCNAMQCNAMQCSAAPCDAMRCDSVRCSAVQRTAMQCDAAQRHAMPCKMQCHAIQSDPIQHKYNTIHNTTQYTNYYTIKRYNARVSVDSTIAYKQQGTTRHDTTHNNTNWTQHNALVVLFRRLCILCILFKFMLFQYVLHFLYLYILCILRIVVCQAYVFHVCYNVLYLCVLCVLVVFLVFAYCR